VTKKAERKKPAGDSPYDSELLLGVGLKVKVEGFVPVSVLREAFGADRATQAIALLYRDLRMFREVRRAWKDGDDALGYEWADKRFSRSEVKKLPPVLGELVDHLAPPISVRYQEFEHVVARCRWTTPILGSVPVKDRDGHPTNMFERDYSGRALILAYHQRAMASDALPLIGKEAAIARHIKWSTIRIPIGDGNGHAGATLKIVEHGIVERGRDGGKGLRRSESLLDPIEFGINAIVPTSVIAVSEYLRMLREGGGFVRLSPGRSAGFGEFEVIGAE